MNIIQNLTKLNNNIISIENSLRIGWQRVNWSPVNPGGQEQTGKWLITWHLAPTPQVPAQGSLHFWFEHASFKLQSELTVHSGRQVGGLPIKPTMQEQTAWLFTSLHWLLGPQGEGWQGCFSTGAVVNIEVIYLCINFFLMVLHYFNLNVTNLQTDYIV